METQPNASPGYKPGAELGDLTMLMGIVAKHREKRGGLIAILQEIQSRYSYLPEHALRLVAENTGHSLTDVYGVATFYRAFSLKPRGKHLVTACLGTACHVRSGAVIAGELERVLEIKAGETTEDGMFTLETAACLGACALGPIVVVDGEYYSKVKKADVAGPRCRVSTSRRQSGPARPQSQAHAFPFSLWRFDTTRQSPGRSAGPRPDRVTTA